MTIDRHFAVAGLAGLANVVAVLGSVYVAESMSFDVSDPIAWVLFADAAIASFLLGAGPAYAFVRYRLVLPLPLTARGTYLVVIGAGNALHDFVEVYFIPLFAAGFLGVVATVAAVEYGVRAWSGIAEPKPLF